MKLTAALIAVYVVRWTVAFTSTTDAEIFYQAKQNEFASRKEAIEFIYHSPEGAYECSQNQREGFCFIKEFDMVYMKKSALSKKAKR